MDKKSFKFTKVEPEVITIEYQEQEVKVRSILYIAEQAQLIENYIQNRFFPKEVMLSATGHDILGAEHALRLDIIQALTDIEVSDEDISIFLYGDIFYQIENAIENYEEFQDVLYQTIEDVEKSLALKSSVGKVLEGLSVKVSSFLENMNEISKNLKPEDLDKIKDIAGNLEKQLASPLIGGVVDDMQRGKVAG